MIQQRSNIWNIPAENVLVQLASQQEGLSSEEAKKRLASHGANLAQAALRFCQFEQI